MALVSMTPAETSALIEQVREHGFDPATTRCCVPSAGLPGSVKGVLGCNMADRCVFHLKTYGGFRNKTWRPRNVLVYNKPDTDKPNQNKFELPCYLFIQLLRNKERQGRIDFQDGGRGEIIRIVGHEGDKYEQLQIKKVDPKVKDSPFTNEPVPVEMTVNEYRHPGAFVGSKGERDMEREMMAAIQADAELEEGVAPGVSIDDWAADAEIHP